MLGDIAQLGERLPCKQEVAGSIPTISTNGGGVAVVTNVQTPSTNQQSVCARKRRGNEAIRSFRRQAETERAQFDPTRACSSVG